MKKMLTYVLIGIGIGLLIAPRPGEETRRRLQAMLQQRVGPQPPDREALQRYYQKQGTGEKSESAQALKGLAQEALKSQTPGTLTAQAPKDYPPAYPEYTNPELQSGS